MKQPGSTSFQSTSDDEPSEFYVSRLERLIRLRHDFEEHLNPLGVELLDRSIFATLRDCMESGAGEKARELMAAATPTYRGDLQQ